MCAYTILVSLHPSLLIVQVIRGTCVVRQEYLSKQMVMQMVTLMTHVNTYGHFAEY